MNNEIGKEQLKPIVWIKPDVLPTVKVGKSKEFWVAIEVTRKDKKPEVVCFLSNYLNKPIAFYVDDSADTGCPLDYVLSDECGQSIDAVGWHSNREHYEFDDFYEPLTFSDSYVLLAWAEYTPPDCAGALD